MQNFQDIEHFVKTLSAAIKKKIPTKVSQLTNDVGYKTTDTNTTYKLSKSGSTVTLTGSDGSITSVTDDNATYSSLKNPYSLDIQNNGTTVASYDGSTAKTANFTNATTSANGLMSAADKSKLDGVASTYATKGELNDQISSVKAGAIDQIVNLTAAGWTGDTAPYSQTVNVTGMTDELLCELFSACPKSATVAEREAYNEAFALVASGYAETADGSATFLVDEKPAIDIGVRIKSISKANAVSDQTSSDITNAVDAMSNTLEGRINSLTADLANKASSSDFTTLQNTLANNYYTKNPQNLPSGFNSTNLASMHNLKNGWYWHYSGDGTLNFPSDWGFMFKFGFEGVNDFSALFFTQSSGSIYRCSGNTSTISGWVKI